MPERNNEYVYQPPAKFTEELRQRINNAGFSDEFKQQIKSTQKEEGRKMFERLTRWENNDKDVADLIEEKSDFDGLTEAINHLAAYEDSGLSAKEVQELAKFKALSQLKVGNIVYHITQTGQIEEILIDCIGATGTLLNGDIAIIPAGNFGKTVFLTREAAEKALERRQTDGCGENE